MVDKITTPPTNNEVIEKVNEIIDDKQDTLVSGTNIKTINNQSILGTGNIEIQGSSGGLQNTATGENSLTILGTPCTYMNGINIGYGAKADSQSVVIGNGAEDLGGNSVVIGNSAKITSSQADSSVIIGSDANSSSLYSVTIGRSAKASSGYENIAIGTDAQAKASYAIQIGSGTNTNNNTMQVFSYQLLNTNTGLIPTDRLTPFTGANGTNAGTKGAVPAPTATDNDKFLRGDGTWAEASGGGSITVDTAMSLTSTNPVQNKVITETTGFVSNISLGKSVNYTGAEYRSSDLSGAISQAGSNIGIGSHLTTEISGGISVKNSVNQNIKVLDTIKQDVSNLVTSISSSSTDTQYPSAKCVYDLVGDVESAINMIRGV